jgi:hypothetical protein
MKYMRATIDALETNNKITNIRDLHRGIKDFKKAYQPRTNTVKDEKSYLVTGSHNILAK